MLKVMLAEDDPTMVSLLKTLLKMEGFDVIALDMDENVPAEVAKRSPDVILVDIHFGLQNGLEILDGIRDMEKIRKTRVVMTSGLNMKEECLRRGADDFLLKPFMPDDLVGMLKKKVKV